jgi:hypothetical protein
LVVDVVAIIVVANLSEFKFNPVKKKINEKDEGGKSGHDTHIPFMFALHIYVKARVLLVTDFSGSCLDR